LFLWLNSKQGDFFRRLLISGCEFEMQILRHRTLSPNHNDHISALIDGACGFLVFSVHIKIKGIN